MWDDRKEKVQNDSLKRDGYARDRARIIHSAFFRRLQGKTQVLGLGESDFYRTRLTHSLEVAQVGGGIAEALREKYKKDENIYKLIPDQNLIESIGLAHDIGHPPFGHGGEVALNYCMREFGGFEGNAQTLRICTELGEYSEGNGLNLTRRTLLGLLKYPGFYSFIVNKLIYKECSDSREINSFKPPKCIFDSDKSSVEWIFEMFNENDKAIFFSVDESSALKHKKTKYKSFDCSIMELADDISYGIHDLEDAISLSLVKRSQWNDQVLIRIKKNESIYPLAKDIELHTENLFSDDSKLRKSSISKLVNYFISKVEVEKLNIFSDDLLDHKARLPLFVMEELELFKNFVKENVIKLPEVQMLEYKGEQMIVKLFEALSLNPERLLPSKYKYRYEQAGTVNEKSRVICDYLAGTTDDYATKIYHKIFTPSSGSIFDKL